MSKYAKIKRPHDKLPPIGDPVKLAALPLAKLIKHVHVDSPHWKSLQQAVCAQRTHISLLVGDSSHAIARQVENQELPLQRFMGPPFTKAADMTPGFKPDFPGTEHTRLEVDTLSRTCVCDLVRMFPAVTTLEIAINLTSMVVFEEIVFLLTRYASTLITFKMWAARCYETNIPSSDKRVLYFTHLLSAINSLYSLRHLTFFVDMSMWKQEMTDYKGPMPKQYKKFQALLDDMHVFARLEELNFYSTDCVQILAKSLAKFAVPNNRLQKIRTQMWLTEGFDEDPIQLIESNLIDRFDEMAISVTSQSVGLLLAATNLTSLQVHSFNDYTLMELFETLEQLKHLSSLFVSRVKFGQKHNGPSFDRMIVADESLLPRFPALRQLQFWPWELPSHTTFDWPHWAYMFPALEEVTIQFQLVNCAACRYKMLRSTRKQRNECARGFVHTWTQCPSMKRIVARPNVYVVYDFFDFDEQGNERDKIGRQPYHAMVDTVVVNC